MSETPKVYAAILSVMERLSKDGIAKDRKNEQQGYKFRGIDEVYNALSPVLAECGLVILPRFSDREVVERESASKKALFYVTLKGEFDLICTEDGSKHTVGPFYGEAMDSGDKATNKAMSAAFKYMAMEVFVIPTEGDNDADSTTHEVAAKHGRNGKEVNESELNRMSAAEQEIMRVWADTITDLHNANLEQDAADKYYDLDSHEKKMAVWALLDSKVRASIKKLHKVTKADVATA